MEADRNCVSIKQLTCTSLPNIFNNSESKNLIQTQRSSSLHFPTRSCLLKLQSCNREKDKMKVSNPTIGDLLGDDDLFHSRYHHYYTSKKSTRKRHYSPSHHSNNERYRSKHRRSTHSHRSEKFQHPISPSTTTESTLSTSQIYPYPTFYNYLPISSYGCYCYSNMASYCSCLVSDCYARSYYNETGYESFSAYDHERQ
ncbi:unnamed protein product [Adineta ricciae]|uniref:Uncharacterized protein n=1 Tax=Adineta ricciae TaxID=249248 RepID=A0A815YQ28_ADIRI|nr:unnamed protein product [Adineta ricciae]